MKGWICIIIVVSWISTNLNAQDTIRYIDDEEVLSLSVRSPKVTRLKKSNRINCLQLPTFTSDSLFWERNIHFMIPKAGYDDLVYRRAGGPIIDTAINFFDSATRIRIKEGYLWIYRIYSPSAKYIGALIDSISLRRDQYVCMYSNFIDSVGVMPYNYDLQYTHTPSIYELEDFADSIFSYSKEVGDSFYDKNMYIEVFSPDRSIEKSEVRIVNINHGWPYDYSLSDAPAWIRERYPNIDFDRNCIKSEK